MSIYKRGDQWWMRFNLQGRQIRKSCQTTNKKLALSIFHKQKSLIAEGRYLDCLKEDSKIGFKEFIPIYMDQHAKIYKRGWQKADRTYMNRFLPFFDGYKLSQITGQMILHYMQTRLKEVKPATVNRELSCLKVIFNKAEEWGYLSKNPARSLKKLKGESSGRTRFLSDSEIERLYSACCPSLRDICMTLIHTGLRKGELQRLIWSDINFENNQIFVNKTKSGSSRYVGMSLAVKNLLLQRKVREQKAHPNHLLVFGSKNDNIYNFRKAFETARKRAGLEDVTIHDLRHTFASQATMMGHPPRVIQNALGHYDIRMTERYSHLSEECSKKIYSTFDDLKSTKIAQSGFFESEQEFENLVSSLK